MLIVYTAGTEVLQLAMPGNDHAACQQLTLPFRAFCCLLLVLEPAPDPILLLLHHDPPSVSCFLSPSSPPSSTILDKLLHHTDKVPVMKGPIPKGIYSHIGFHLLARAFFWRR
jgi:hypothetical protein